MARKSQQVYLTEQDRVRLRKLIGDYSGLDESALFDSGLDRAIAHRLAARGLDYVVDYWPLLRSGADGEKELGSLVQLLTNKETFFFRETHQFEVLQSQILPELMAKGHSSLRLWSAGCATGEEPYSLAIALLEYQARRGGPAAHVMATDIDEAALERARQGRYDERAVRLVPDHLRQKYLTFDGRHYTICPNVARLVTFERYNLASERIPSALGDMDVIFCRNVTIYLNPNARDRLNARLAGSLREGGYLFVASAETMGHDLDRLELISAGKTFLFRKTQPAPRWLQQRSRGSATRTTPVTQAPVPVRQAPAALATEALAAPALETPVPLPLLERALVAFQRQEYDAALLELDRLPIDGALWEEACCLRGATLLQQERLEEAETACQQLLAHDPWHADAHFLMGLILRQQDQIDAAVQSLKQAVYLQPRHRDAHFYLAETYRSLGMDDQARREYENTLNILARFPGGMEPNLTGLGDETLRQACTSHLRRLGVRPGSMTQSRRNGV